MSEADRRGARLVGEESGCVLTGVSNLWLPVFLTALNRIRIGGAFAFIVPTECFTGISARAIRSWLLRNCRDLQVDLFPVGSFPGALQEVIVLSGTRGVGDGNLNVVEHFAVTQRAWSHHISGDVETWTRFLLTPGEVAAFEEARSLSGVSSLNDLARFRVATVTGANDFFSLSEASVEEHGLRRWSRPLLPRIRHAEGLVFTERDHAHLRSTEERSWMLDFRAHRGDPLVGAAPRSYIEAGEAGGLHLRYKTRIRNPWFQVPVVAPGQILLSKRSHRFARMVVNEAAVVTTDTIYQGSIRSESGVTPQDFVAAFHNSLTLLSSEIEGRSFGGGVLELVPSEVARLVVAVPPGFGDELSRLDAIARGRGGDSDDLVDETDRLLDKYSPGFSPALFETLRGAYESLRRRRLARSDG
nr:SAM-dependent methyltransferase [Cellulosimicrobium cellulans]